MTKITVSLAVRGGFKSKRGTYSASRGAKRDIPGGVEDALPYVLEVIEEAKRQVCDDEVVLVERVSLVHKSEEEGS